jgi:hypothetical protein
MPTTSSDLSQFKGNLHGQLITSHDGDYEEARTVWNGMIDKRPELIVRCTDKSDVILTLSTSPEPTTCSPRFAAADTMSPASAPATAAW